MLWKIIIFFIFLTTPLTLMSAVVVLVENGQQVGDYSTKVGKLKKGDVVVFRKADGEESKFTLGTILNPGEGQKRYAAGNVTFIAEVDGGSEVIRMPLRSETETFGGKTYRQFMELFMSAYHQLRLTPISIPEVNVEGSYSPHFILVENLQVEFTLAELVAQYKETPKGQSFKVAGKTFTHDSARPYLEALGTFAATTADFTSLGDLKTADIVWSRKRNGWVIPDMYDALERAEAVEDGNVFTADVELPGEFRKLVNDAISAERGKTLPPRRPCADEFDFLGGIDPF